MEGRRMEAISVIEIMNREISFLHESAGSWLSEHLPTIVDNWWQELVLSNLSVSDYNQVIKDGIHDIDQLSLPLQLQVLDRNWFVLSSRFNLDNCDRELIHRMQAIYARWSEIRPCDLTSGSILDDASVVMDLMNIFGASPVSGSDLAEIIKKLEDGEPVLADGQGIEASKNSSEFKNDHHANRAGSQEENLRREIKVGDVISLTSDPARQGAVIAISGPAYQIFIDGGVHLFYREQISLPRTASQEKQEAARNLSQVRASLTAYQVHNPGAQSLYSLNSARIDFVPYQFRPALKMIHADEPRILVADDVGVGKTIEAGLILKELEARSSADSVLVICPRPLVAERKWQLEMKRFDENFTQLDGKMLQECISDTDRDGEWPEAHKKTIIPYSLFNEDTIMGHQSKSRKKHKEFGLTELDPFPHFDLVIVDEAHTIRNPQTWMYIGTSMFCENAEAVVFLTATPVQNSNDDLYTLLNLLRSDVVVDKDTFKTMSEPNRYINNLLRIVRTQKHGWQKAGQQEIDYILTTKWGRDVVQHNPYFGKVYDFLCQKDVTREERIDAISNIESLHSFHSMISRTRRRDIEDFCIRRTETVKVPLNQPQAELYSLLNEFEQKALEMLHGDQNTYFMMCTILRQAASCIYGLAPFMQDIVNRRLEEIQNDGDFIDGDFDVRVAEDNRLHEMADDIIRKSRLLPKEDPKYDQLLEVIQRKQKEKNNRIIVFSSFRHTLTYVRTRLEESGIRVGQVDGSVSDEERYKLRERFKAHREERTALDVLLFSEVGSEGLDYQFCDTLINYDLPWNPMRIEQRIGRIDRRGQKSDTVLIYNLISAGTIDENVYDKCLLKIGVFESSVGDCSEILGTVGNSIFRIMFDRDLSDAEKDLKMQQLADNKIMQVRELNRIEQEEKSLYGFDLSEFVRDKEVQSAENTWISPESLQELLIIYLKDLFGEGEYLRGKGEKKTLILSEDKRQHLLRELTTSYGSSSGSNIADQKWRSYLKSHRSRLEVTFSSDYAKENRETTFLTQMHPLMQQAAKHECRKFPVDIVVEAPPGSGIGSGQYEFQIYAWSYLGLKPDVRLSVVSTDDRIEENLLSILQSAETSDVRVALENDIQSTLQGTHYQKWLAAREHYMQDVREECFYRLDQMNHSFRKKLAIVEERIRKANDENIIRMRVGEKANLERKYEEQKHRVEDMIRKADIHSELLVRGKLLVK